MDIDGQTRVIPHLAFPAAHVRTPGLCNARCRALGLNAVVVPWEVQPADLAATFAAIRAARSVPGVIVTIPHKEAVTAHCDRLEGIAADLRVANIIRKDADGALVGAMLDGWGFVAGLRAQDIEPGGAISGASVVGSLPPCGGGLGRGVAQEQPQLSPPVTTPTPSPSPQGGGENVAPGLRTLLLGAGGAATAIADALLNAGVAELVIANRSPEKAERLVARLGQLHPGSAVAVGEADATGFALVVNATSVGLAGDPGIPLDPATIAPGAIVAEVIMQPAMTPLLVAASARGARIHFGEHMLAAQIDLFIDFLLEPAGRGVETPRRAAGQA